MAMPPDPEGKINASPTKSFFIDILVKDIDLIDAVLDLIDNSIDSYIKKRISERKRILITVSDNAFKIEDHCGGINKEDVYDHVFRFGKSSEERARTIGIYGIGLKRAIFKMGKNILLESDDGSNFYSIRIDEDWLKNVEKWTLDFEKEENTRGNPMTRVTITELYPNIADEFKSTVFENTLRERIRDTYSIFMEEKVTIEVNDRPVDFYDFKFLSDGEKFAPFHKKYNFDDVEVEIFAGYTPGGREKWPYGWYVFCNDRLIIKSDTSERTGWGGYGERKYHYPEDNQFLGLVFFRSDNPMSLPWQTTKDDVQVDSRVYRATQVEMKEVTSRLVDVIHLAGKTIDPGTRETIGTAIFEDTPTISRKDVTVEQQEIVPAIRGELGYESLSKVPVVTSIQYMEKTALVNKVKAKLGEPWMSNKKMGQKTFEYYVKWEEIKDE